MVTVKLMGGMGNQMFQYALGRYLSIKNNDSLRLDLNFLLDRTPRPNFTFRDYDLDIFAISPSLISTPDKLGLTAKLSYSPILSRLRIDKIASKLIGSEKILRDQVPTKFYPETINAIGNIYLAGYWQSPKYFEAISGIIRKDFTIKQELTDPNSEIAKTIRAKNSVCVNVRRADFVNNPEAAKYHGFSGLEYYENAEKIISEQIPDPHFVVTSDDIKWCRENLKFNHPTTYVGHEHKGHKFANYLWLMTECKHFIIPNSSFAWWAAWLSKNEQKIIIAPKNWFNDSSIDTSDLIPADWIRI